jgi:TrpR-related protein YerC/YecD
MGKYTNLGRLTKNQQDELFAGFARALSKLKSPVEAASFIRDLYTEQEALILARRLQIAEMLNDGLTYSEIVKATKASTNTIARIQAWLRLYGEGCRGLFKRIRKKASKPKEEFYWPSIKKKYPLYYWPELLLDHIIKTANRREKERLLKVIQGMREKTKLTKQLLALLT